MTVREKLRSATRDLHTRLDSIVAQDDIAQEQGYCRFLLANAEALLAVEQALERSQVLAVMPDWPHRSRSSALLADMDGLCLRPLAIPDRFPGLRTRAQIVGALYVLEGSRLGSAVLHGRAAASASEAVRSNVRFLTHGRGLGLWKSFLAQLDRELTAPDLQDEAAAAARTVFAAFEAAFTRQAIQQA